MQEPQEGVKESQTKRGGTKSGKRKGGPVILQPKKKGFYLPVENRKKRKIKEKGRGVTFSPEENSHFLGERRCCHTGAERGRRFNLKTKKKNTVSPQFGGLVHSGLKRAPKGG